MDKLQFMDYTFMFNSSHSTYTNNEEGLTFFNLDGEVRIKIRFKNERLVLLPQSGVTIKKVDDKTYRIIANEYQPV
ncbi:hypothetical protein AKUA1202_14630 [Apilactobacillus kunkeei]|uniref:hypothetical protein n=1 Tax=Apilactobacillus TaxID=2767877 RepID=UPI00200A94C7|nr:MULTISPECIES: hypothetical protein [Apilactobacillus]MCK8618801.1 hypothetical protein [Apilactobacillus kunkeei]MDN2612639.1 hypothetical protein [Apilactobacillus sp. EABW-1NA]CAI2660455.1 hypothetical protein AKUA1401_13840 [Apilactobacillus kunkeei]CAI2664714.1 hypothetical protein AKUH4B202J_13830 [Apilactobacillus kunkeei]CAI2664961.1 hypothetical protein AKUH3B204M_13750 [Apilactobacillus kunkeei]